MGSTGEEGGDDSVVQFAPIFFASHGDRRGHTELTWNPMENGCGYEFVVDDFDDRPGQ